MLAMCPGPNVSGKLFRRVAEHDVCGLGGTPNGSFEPSQTSQLLSEDETGRPVEPRAVVAQEEVLRPGPEGRAPS